MSIQLAPVSDASIDAIGRLAADPEVLAQTLLPKPYPPDGARQFVAHIARASVAGQEHAFAILAPELVGVCGVRLLAEGVGEIGYWIGRPYWRRGYASAAAAQLVDLCRETLALSELRARVLDSNVGSLRVLRGVGLRELRRAPNAPDTRWPPDAVTCHYARALSRHDPDRAPAALHGPRYQTRDAGDTGHGVFATAPIAAGALVMLMRGQDIPTAAITPGLRVMQLGPDRWLAEEPLRPDASDFINHACEPNLSFYAGTTALLALRDIAPGEELSFDYSTTMNEPGWAMDCRCGAARCRGQVRSFDALPPKLREALAPRALTWLRAGLGSG